VCLRSVESALTITSDTTVCQGEGIREGSVMIMVVMLMMMMMMLGNSTASMGMQGTWSGGDSGC
jgi:hypothetical protein